MEAVKSRIVILLLVIAILARPLGLAGFFPSVMGLIRSSIYIFLMIAWGFSVRTRVIQVHVRKYLTAVSALAVLWMLLRTMKFFFIPIQSMARPIWYLYYLPMLFIPLLAVYVALSLGQSENYRLPKKVWTLFLFTALLLILVLTNDFHQMVFTFPAKGPWTDYNNGYAIGYILILVWECVLGVAAFLIMAKRCRIRLRLRVVPLTFIGLAIGYSILYYAGVGWLRVIAGDFTVVQCGLFMLSFESCIRCGLIQTNTGYDELFEACTFGVQITDADYRIHFTSRQAPQLSPEMMRKAEKIPCFPDRNTQVKSAPIPGGHVLWKEDIRELVAAIEDLEDAGKELSERNRIARENYKTEQRILSLREKNRLMDLFQQETASQIELLNQLRLQYENENDQTRRRLIMAKLAMVGTYIKRCGNLLFINESSDTTDMAEFGRCMKESFSCLELIGITCGMDLPEDETLNSRDAICTYRIFETVLETAVEHLQSVWLKGRKTETHLLLRLEVCSRADLSKLSDIADDYSCEENVSSFTMRFEKGGGCE